MLRSSSISRKDKITALAIGGFDGMHLAHQQLISRLEGEGALLIVEKHFATALTPGEVRCRFAPRECACFFLDFEMIRSMRAERFVDFLAEQFPALRKIVVGYDFRFGKDRLGDPKMFEKIPGVEVEVVEEQKCDGISVHADTIRKLLRSGEVDAANRLLGRLYTIRGEVISGQGLGTRSLYPTLNIRTQNYLLPREGVYITRASLHERTYPALTFIGRRLSTDAAFSIETHILDSTITDEVQEVEVRFLSFLRENRKFDDLKHLKAQIGEDIAVAKAYFTD